MAFMRVEFFSEVLHMAVAAEVVLPQAAKVEIGINAKETRDSKHPVLWLLHGATDDHTTWARRTSIERYASKMGLAVVMPGAHLSSYSNMAHGGAFYDYITEELPSVMRQFFPLSEKWKDNFIAGNSMGGFGSLKIGINHPDRYSAIGCFSAGASTGRPLGNRGGLFDDASYRMRNVMLHGGKDLSGTLEDTYHMAEKNKNLPELPRVFHSCGADDFLVDEAHRMRDFFLSMEGNPYSYVYEEHPGVHGWEYWDTHILDFLRFLNLDIPEDTEITN